MQRGTPPEEAVDQSNNHRHIIQFFDSADSDFSPQYFIAVEQSLLVQCKTMKIALFSLLAVHYIFDIEYHYCVKDFYRFVQENLFEIPDTSKRSVTLSNVFTGIHSFTEK